LLLALHILTLLQPDRRHPAPVGKGGGLAGGAFGGTAQTVFGGRGATDFVTRATMVLGGAFFLTSLILALMSTNLGQPSRSLMQEEARKAASSAPRQLPGQQGAPSGQAPSGQAPSGAAPSGQPAPAPTGGAPATPTPPTQPK
jgi:preprotein translocase subunit SecG